MFLLLRWDLRMILYEQQSYETFYLGMMEAAKCMFCFWYEWFHISEFVFETIFNCIDKTNEHNLKEKKTPGYDFNNVNAKKKTNKF